jgi:hypothetical protein
MDEGDWIMNSIDEAIKLPVSAADAATISIGSDRYPATVIAHDTDSGVISVRYDNDVVVKGSTMDGSAEYEYSSDPNGRIENWRKNRQGRFTRVVRNAETGRWNQVDYGGHLHIGDRRKYYDPSF